MNRVKTTQKALPLGELTMTLGDLLSLHPCSSSWDLLISHMRATNAEAEKLLTPDHNADDADPYRCLFTEKFVQETPVAELKFKLLDVMDMWAADYYPANSVEDVFWLLEHSKGLPMSNAIANSCRRELRSMIMMLAKHWLWIAMEKAQQDDVKGRRATPMYAMNLRDFVKGRGSVRLLGIRDNAIRLSWAVEYTEYSLSNENLAADLRLLLTARSSKEFAASLAERQEERKKAIAEDRL